MEESPVALGYGEVRDTCRRCWCAVAGLCSIDVRCRTQRLQADNSTCKGGVTQPLLSRVWLLSRVSSCGHDHYRFDSSYQRHTEHRMDMCVHTDGAKQLSWEKI